MPGPQTPADGNPKAATESMTGRSASFWVNEGEKRALEVFHSAATNVPIYRDFLAAHKLDHTQVRDIRQFMELVPISDRQSRFAGTMDRLFAGDVTDAHMFFMSGGTTGDSLVAAVGRETMRAYPQQFAAMFDAQWGICNPDKKVLLVNALALGAWGGGMVTSAIFAEVSQQHSNIAYMCPGTDVDRILDLVETAGTHFDMIMMMSYPTFITEILHAGQKRGIDWKSVELKFTAIGERMDIHTRRKILEMISSPVDHYAILNQYAGSELGTPGVETPIATMITRLACEDVGLCRDIFGEDTPHTLLQNNPMGSFIEIVDNQVIGTYGGFMPVVRYSPKDTGQFLGFDEMCSILRDHGVDIVETLVKDGWNKPVIRWPFLILGLRADRAVSIYGAKISPFAIEDIIAADRRIHSFALLTDGDGEFTTLRLHLELPQDASLAEDERKSLGDLYALKVLERLLEVNFDFRDAWDIHADAMAPKVHVHDYAQGPFEPQKGAFKPKSHS